MKFFNRSCDQAQPQPNDSAPSLCLRLMASGNENEVEEVRKELLKAGIPSEKRRHPIAEAFGVSGVELWVQNERDFFNASLLYARMQHLVANRPEAAAASQKPETSRGAVSGLKRKAAPSSTAAKDVSKLESKPVVQPPCAELKQASSLLQKGIEEMLMRESDLASECASLQSKIEELTRTLAQQERALSDAHRAMAAEREARVAAEERIGLVEESLQSQWVERQELERQIQAHATSLGSLLTRVASKGFGSTVQP